MILLAWLLVLGCTPADLAAQDPHDCAAGRLVGVTTDYAVGAIVTAQGDSVRDALAPTSGDPMVETAGCEVLQADRAGGDRVRRWSAGDWSAPAQEVALNVGANVHGLALLGDDLLVAGWGESSLLLVDGSSGLISVHADLGELADDDGLPELEDVLVVGDDVWVSAQRFDQASWKSEDGRLARIADGRVAEVLTTGPSPFLTAVVGSERLLVQTGVYFVADGGLAWLDPSNGVLEPIWEDPVVDLVGAAGLEDTAVVLSASLDGSEYAVHCIAADGTRSQALTTRSFLTDVVVGNDGIAWVAVRRNVDATGEPGLLRVDTDGCVLLDDTPLPTLLEPWDLAWSQSGESR